MSIPDSVLMDFFVLATNVPRTELPAIERQVERDPMAAKKRLARTIVTEFHGEAAAHEAEERFERTVQRREIPDDIPAFAPKAGQLLLDALAEAGLAPSRRETRRLFDQGAVTVDGQPVGAAALATPGTVVQVGKRRWLRLVP
jgi:tyrosyl-tRNA synthetase